MTPKRWQTIEDLFHRALEKEPGSRSSFLQEACGEDESLRKEVESLLRYQTQSHISPEAPDANWVARAMRESQARCLIGRQLGAYQIVSLLGEGGFSGATGGRLVSRRPTAAAFQLELPGARL
jgi:eukaryotic-like serine/threonine-protein kinase